MLAHLLFATAFSLAPPVAHVKPVVPKVVYIRPAPVESDAAYSARLAAQLCEVKPWVFCDPRVYR